LDTLGIKRAKSESHGRLQTSHLIV